MDINLFKKISIYTIALANALITAIFIGIFHFIFPDNGGAFIGVMVGLFCYVLGINFFIMFHKISIKEYWLQWLFFLLTGVFFLLTAKFICGKSIRAFHEIIEILKLIVMGHLFINMIAFGVKYVLHLLDNEEW